MKYEYDDAFLNMIAKEICKMFNVNDVVIEFPLNDRMLNKSMSRRPLQGYYLSSSKKIRVNCQFGILSMIQTIMHELTHHEQYASGRLENIQEDDLVVGHIWETVHYDHDYPYEISPWEVDANDQQSKKFFKFVNCVDKQILNKLMDIHTSQMKGK